MTVCISHISLSRPAIHHGLIRIRDAINTNPSMRPGWIKLCYGLCTNFSYMYRFSFGQLVSVNLGKDCEDLFRSWPLFSGDIEFPVAAGEADYPAHALRLGGFDVPTPEYAYQWFDDKYDVNTEYGRNRRALLDYLIEQTKEQ